VGVRSSGLGVAGICTEVGHHAANLSPSGKRDRSSLGIGLLKIDSQPASHVVVCAGLGAVALALGIVSPERRLRRRFGAGAPGQRGSCCGQEQDAEHGVRRPELAVAMAARQKLSVGRAATTR
jgi:hypothetical protein